MPIEHRPGHSLGEKSDEHLQCTPRSWLDNFTQLFSWCSSLSQALDFLNKLFLLGVIGPAYYFQFRKIAPLLCLPLNWFQFSAKSSGLEKIQDLMTNLASTFITLSFFEIQIFFKRSTMFAFNICFKHGRICMPKQEILK